MIMEIQPYIVREKFNDTAYESMDNISGFYQNALVFEPMAEIEDFNCFKTMIVMMRTYSNTDFINIGSISSQTVLRGGVKKRNPPVLFITYPLAKIISDDILTKLKNVSILDT